MPTETPDPESTISESTIDFILDLFAQRGAAEYMGDAVRLRYYDDDGKVAGLTIKPVTAYRETLTSLMLR